ncbi:conserved hypothetical protein [Vibrio aestuarianus]|uniref:Replication gene A protein-like domain-containing protein n=8 Tax=Vibrio aestuarianus TaxID=28171 RepID=A0ABN8TR80_9VIBR|nr:replication endonuclease [Vibrio aestuarianus]MDE1227205.1 replication endonuclease [Vibrio aestuarianus]MDE1255295.1 replication endonuclease [Vibrio aestuarianus]MDE1307749.1 replication endonuclease [Vibrio aestuarianus]NLS56659.1 replication endonuclease [Vibrio aestuarianus subsp. francensis]CAH8185269.1 conserved hypothetical protein [Vibrio aestuarianus]
MAFINNESYLDYLKDIDKNKSLQNQFEINNYIKLSFETGKNEKSVFLDSLLSQEHLDISIRDIFNKFIENNFNTNRNDILKNKDLVNLAKTFSVVAKTFDYKYNFKFYGLTFENFMPKGSYSREQKIIIALSKLQDYEIILGKLKTIYHQQLELFQIKNGSVKEYMSNKLYSLKLEDKKKVDDFLDSQYIEIVNQKNEVEELSLLDLKEKTKQNKMNELMMIKNYINTYQKMGWQARFITVTNNSTDLPRAYNSKDKQHWDGITTPQDNARRLQQIWRNIQSRAVRNGIEMIGIICREPHKNGGVHMHLLILVAPQHAYDSKKVRKMTNYQTINKLGKYKALKKEILESSMTIEKLFLHAYGYTNRSCKIDVLSGGKKNNNVVNYITKYIMKTIDVRNYNGTELNDTDKKINKISFHRSLWKYRAYSFFGFKNSLNKWRLIRKLKNQHENLSFLIIKDKLMKNLVDCVENNNYKDFVELAEHCETAKFYTKNKHGEIVLKYFGITTNNIYIYKMHEDKKFFDFVEMVNTGNVVMTLFNQYDLKSRNKKKEKNKSPFFEKIEII